MQKTVRDFESIEEIASYPEEYIAAICNADRHAKAVAEIAKWQEGKP